MAEIHRTDVVEHMAIIGELAAPLLRQYVALLVLCGVVRVIEEQLSRAAVHLDYQGTELRVAAFLRSNIIMLWEEMPLEHPSIVCG